MNPRIIAIVGPIRAGKSTTSRYLVSQYGYKLASNAELLIEIAHKLSLGADRSNLGRLGDALFGTLGNDLLAQFRIRRGEYPIVVDGVRYLEEITAYRAEPSFRLLGVTSANQLRYSRARALSDERKDIDLTKEKFAELSNARSERQVDELLREADKLIENNSSVNNLTNAIDSVMAHWSKPGTTT